MSSKFFKDLKGALEEVIAYKEGKLDLRTIEIEVPEPRKKMKTKSFDDYLKTRFSDEKIAEIERRAQTLREEIIESPHMTKRPTFEEFEKRALQDPAFREAYEALRPEFELMIETIKARIKAKALRKNRAKQLKTK